MQIEDEDLPLRIPVVVCKARHDSRVSRGMKVEQVILIGRLCASFEFAIKY